jgi:hypothetical protein
VLAQCAVPEARNADGGAAVCDANVLA